MFEIGCNLPWLDNGFYSAFGGYSSFAQAGARARKAEYVASFTDMVNNRGVQVCRVWIAPVISSDGILRSGNTITGIGGTFVDDIHAVTEAANQAGVRIMWNLTSFDAWTRRPGINIITLFDSVRDTTARNSFMQNFVTPVAQAITSAPDYAATIHSFDAVNEPDWLLTSPNPVSPGQPWTAGDYSLHKFDGPAHTYTEMYTFLQQIRNAVKAVDTTLPFTIGAAGVKWASAWEPLCDFNSPHVYRWSQGYFPMDGTPASYGLSKPSTIGEYPASGYSADTSLVGQVPGALPKTHVQWLGDAFQAGWTGAIAWSYHVDADSGAANGGYNATTGAEAKAFAESLDQAATIQLTPTSASCDETDVMTLRAVNQFGVAVDSTNPSVTTGTFANAVYDPDSFQWTLDYTSPTCASGITDVTVSLDVNGVTANESLAIATCSLFSDDTRLTISQTNCSCETALEYIGGAVDIDCPRLGEVLQYRVIGCNCEYECGKPKFEQIHRTRNPVSLSGDVLSIGPLVTTELPVIDISCEDC